MLDCLLPHFPNFHYKINFGQFKVEKILPPLTEVELERLDTYYSLPSSYKAFLRCMGGISMYVNGTTPFVMYSGYPFSFMEGTLCFADYFKEADGDNLVFDTSNGLINGEYSVLYYAHDFAKDEDRGLRKLADSFGKWLESL